MQKNYWWLFFSKFALASTTSTAVLNISGNLPSSISINIQEITQNQTTNQNSLLNTNLPMNNSPILETKLNLQVQCVGTVQLTAYISSSNNFKLVSLNNPATQVPYSVEIINGSNSSISGVNSAINSPTTFSVLCNNKSTNIPLDVKSTRLPVDYTAGVYQDDLLLILTY